MHEKIGQDESLEELIEEARAGPGRAGPFERLVDRFYGRIWRWALARTGHPDDADDVTQEVLVRLYRGLASYEGDARFTTWLYALVRNAAVDLHRQQARRDAKRRDLARRQRVRSAAAGGAGGVDDERAVALVGAFLTELSDRQREAFDLVDLQGHTPTEAAELMGLDPVTVRTHLFRARRAIRGRILESHPELVEGYGP